MCVICDKTYNNNVNLIIENCDKIENINVKLKNIISLKISNCPNLKKIDFGILNVNNILITKCDSLSVIRYLRNINNLIIVDCTNLEIVKNLFNINNFVLSGLNALSIISYLTNMNNMTIHNCEVYTARVSNIINITKKVKQLNYIRMNGSFNKPITIYEKDNITLHGLSLLSSLL
jgi:hypothetical protein